jgi:hypothetical protein
MKTNLIVLVLVALGSIVGCAAPMPAPMAAAPTAAPASLALAPQPAVPPGAGADFQSKSADSTGEVQNAQSAPSAASAERMIVYNAQLSLEVQDADKASTDIAAIAAQFKGYVSGANLVRDSKGQMSGTITIRIPAESLDTAQKQIEAIGLKVLSRNKNSNDVTDQYTDLNARLTNLTATEADLRKLMDSTTEKTNKADDILAVFRELTNVRTQIEQIKGQMNVLEKTSALATLTISLQPHQEIQVLEPDTWVPNKTAAQALKSLVQALQGLADLTIWVLLFLLPVVIVLLIPVFVLVLILRALIRRRTKKPIPTA